MRCPKCHTRLSEKTDTCPSCGAHMQKENNEPTIGRGLVIFIVLGTIILVATGVLYYNQHKNDPEYTQTAIEPDSNLAESNKAKFDTVPADSSNKDSVEIQEVEDAQKVFSSIRGRQRRNVHIKNRNTSNEMKNEEGSETGVNTNASQDPAPSVSTAPKPRIETIETE